MTSFAVNALHTVVLTSPPGGDGMVLSWLHVCDTCVCFFANNSGIFLLDVLYYVLLNTDDLWNRMLPLYASETNASVDI